MFSGRKCHFLSFQVWLGRETRGCSPPRHEGEMGMNGERGGGEERATERGMDGWIWGRRDAQPIRRLRKTRTFQAVQPPPARRSAWLRVTFPTGNVFHVLPREKNIAPTCSRAAVAAMQPQLTAAGEATRGGGETPGCGDHAASCIFCTWGRPGNQR